MKRIISKEEFLEIYERHQEYLKEGMINDSKKLVWNFEIDFNLHFNFKLNLRGADLREADLKWANLIQADLRGAYLPDYMYQVTGCGSDNRPTTYDVLNDQIICGCWACDEGNTLENFEKRIEDVYGENGTKPNEKYYQEYMSAIKFFKEMRKLNAKRNNRL